MAIKTNEKFIPFSNSVTFRKPRGTDLVTASELIPGFCRSKSNVPTPGSLRTIKSPIAGIVPGIKSPPLARPPPHGIYIDRCIIFFLLDKHTDDGVFDDFPKISDHLLKISEDFSNCPEDHTNVPEHFPRISEDVRRLPSTFEEDPKMFRWYTNEFKYNLRDKPDVSEIIDIFTCKNIVFLRVFRYHISRW